MNKEIQLAMHKLIMEMYGSIIDLDNRVNALDNDGSSVTDLRETMTELCDLDNWIPYLKNIGAI